MVNKLEKALLVGLVIGAEVTGWVARDMYEPPVEDTRNDCIFTFNGKVNPPINGLTNYMKTPTETYTFMMTGKCDYKFEELMK